MNTKFKQIVIVCPGGGATGGVELLHQLAHTLNENKVASKILYYPFNKNHSVVPQYLKYSVSQIDYKEAINSDSLFVVSETCSHFVNKFGPSRTMIWWMSVDNYVASGRLIYAIKCGFNPFSYQNIYKRNLINNVVCNLVQSEYARAFLQKFHINNIINLSDYINDDFTAAAAKINISAKKDVILYNPAKGFGVTKKLINLSRQNFIPISGLRRDEVIKLMLNSKLYIDFGNHPGKDRIPREAATLGCVVLTNQRGSAKYYEDVPISDAYKLDDFSDDFSSRASKAIDEILTNFDQHFSHFEGYRKSILNEKERFNSDVIKLIEFLGENLW